MEITITPRSKAEAGHRQELDAIANDLRGLCRAQHSATLEIGEHLHHVLEKRLFVIAPQYTSLDAEKKKPYGAVEFVAKWARAEIGPEFTRSRVSQLIAAHNIVTRVTVDPKPTSEGQLRPLVPLLKKREWTDLIDKIWQEAVRKADSGQPTATQVRNAAKAIVPDAYQSKKKPTAIADLKRLLKKHGAASLKAALTDLAKEL